MDLALYVYIVQFLSVESKQTGTGTGICIYRRGPGVDLALSERVGGALPPAHLHAADGPVAGGRGRRLPLHHCRGARHQRLIGV